MSEDRGPTPADQAAAEIRWLRAELAVTREKAIAYKSAFHSLRMSVEGRLDRLAELLEDTEWVDGNDPAPARPERN